MSEIMQYLGTLVHAQLENKKSEEIPKGIQIDELVEIAHRNQMDYLILEALLKSNITEDKKAYIKPFVMQSLIKSSVQINCLRELEERFETEGIYHQVLKGAVLKKIYPVPEMRDMSDIDVMIYDINLNRAKKVVEEMGFSLYKSVKHHDIYIKDPLLIIELHHELYDKDVDKTQYEYFKKEKHRITKEGKNYALQFSTEDFYVYLIAHMAKHFYETGCGIRNVVDVYLYRQRYEATWKEKMMAEELDKCGLAAFENRIHTLGQVWLGECEPDLFSGMLFSYMIDCGIYGKGEYGIWGKFAMLNKKSSYGNRTYTKWWYYLPPKQYLESDYPWLKQYPFLLVFAWGIRAVHGLFSKDGREKREMILNMKSEDISTIYDIYKEMQLEFKID